MRRKGKRWNKNTCNNGVFGELIEICFHDLFNWCRLKRKGSPEFSSDLRRVQLI